MKYLKDPEVIQAIFEHTGKPVNMPLLMDKYPRNFELVSLYLVQKFSCIQIKEMVNLGITTRQMQRILKQLGVMRTQRDSYILAIKSGRMKYKKLSPEQLKARKTVQSKLRFLVFKRDGFKCKICGSTATEALRLEVDHIDENPTNNAIENLQTLCDRCNKGKSLVSQEIQGSTDIHQL